MLSSDDIFALLITFKLAAVTTVVLLLLGAPFAYWLARTRCRIKVLIEALVALPLVLPPTVLGFYLLVILGPHGAAGRLFSSMGMHPPAFTFTGLVIGSVFYSLPFVVQPLHNAFAALGREPLEQAATLRASPRDRFFSVVLPLCKPGFITAAVLGFAHTLGEFGVVLMIGGNIPGRTKVASIAIYDHVEALDYGAAHKLAGILVAISFALLVIVYSFNKRFRISVT